MQHKTIVFLVQSVIFHNHYALLDALIGAKVREANKGEFRNVVSVMTRNDAPRDLRFDVKCTGTLITRDHVLTAEHCFANMGPSSLYVLVGSVDLRRADHRYISWWITYNLWCTAENKCIEFTTNDMAIIKLYEQVSSRIAPARISPTKNKDLIGVEAVLAGWGQLEDNINPFNMRTASVTVISNADCETYTSNIAGITFEIESRYLCSVSEPMTYVHSGDSGGPIFFGSNIIGITQGLCPKNTKIRDDKRRVNIHFSVDYYRTFIESVMII